jgi:ABC-2 type transport system ATP-binding protein
MDVIVVEKLNKTYRSVWPWEKPSTVLSDVTFSVHQGEIFGFLGHNGAGKTTTMKVLIGLTGASSGRVALFGEPVGDVAIHRRIGYLPESPYFYDYLTAEEFLSFYGRLAGLDRTTVKRRVPVLLERVGLVDAGRRPLRKFSKGMLQRIGLAQALVHDPELIILDEPMSGLDPVGRKEVRDLILSLRDQGKTVFFSTHIISDVEMICDRVGILAKGRMLALGRVEDLINEHRSQSVELVCDGIVGDEIAIIKQSASRILQQGSRCLMIFDRQESLEEVLGAVREHGGKLVSLTPHKGSLEDIFMEQLGR